MPLDADSPVPVALSAAAVAAAPAPPSPHSHKDLAKDAAPHFRKAKKYYDGLAAEMVQHGHICDIFSCALDNVRDWVQEKQQQQRKQQQGLASDSCSWQLGGRTAFDAFSSGACKEAQLQWPGQLDS